MRIVFNVTIVAETQEALTFNDALVSHESMRTAARTLSAKLQLLIRGGHIDAVATIAVGDGPKTFVNLGDITYEQPDRAGQVIR